MSERAQKITDFLAGSPCAGWQTAPLAGDASARRFLRLTGPGGETAILMDADPTTGERLEQFLFVARHLSDAGLAAPRILAADTDLGLALVEDLGPSHFATWLGQRPDEAGTLYAAAVDVLVRLQAIAPPGGLSDIGPVRGAAMIAPLFEFYCPGTDARWQAHVTGQLQAALFAHAPIAGTLVLRDFHAENLIWRPDRTGTDRVGLIDFQDAVRAPPEYDLVSLLRDARREVPAGLRSQMLRQFADATGRSMDDVLAAAAAIGVQRNLRILGIFARLARVAGKKRYLEFVPHVWNMVIEDLEHPALSDLARVLSQAMPPPDAQQMAELAR